MDDISSDNLNRSGVLMLAAVIIGWGTSWPFLKIALNEIPPWTFRGLIAPAAAVLLFAIAYIMKQQIGRPTGQWRALILAALLNVTGWHVFSAFGISLMGSGQASIIAYTMPLWAVLFSMLFIGERPTIRRLSGLVVGLLGLGVLLIGELGVFEAAPLGAVFMLLSAVSWGAGTVVQKHVTWSLPPLPLVGWQLLIGGLPITVVALIVDAPHLEPVSAAAVWSTIYILIFPIILAWIAWFKVIDMVSVTVITVATLLVPVIGVISGNIVLSEAIGWREVISLILVCGSLALVMKKGDS